MIFLLILSLFSVLNAADQMVTNEPTPSNPFVLPVSDTAAAQRIDIGTWVEEDANNNDRSLPVGTENTANQQPTENTVTIPNSVTSFCTTEYVIGGFIGLTFCGFFIFVVVLLESFANPNNV